MIQRTPSNAEECIFLDVNKTATDWLTDIVLCFPYIMRKDSKMYRNRPHKDIELLDQYLSEVLDKYNSPTVGDDLHATTGNLRMILIET